MKAEKHKLIVDELREHIPFTILGAFTGIIVMILFRNLPHETAFTVFYTLHPFHVLLSAMTTASMYSMHKCGRFKMKCSLSTLLLVGYLGAIGIATLSDSIIPFLGETLLAMPHREVHIGFIEKWWLINPLAILGIIIAYYKPSTKFPHFGHVFISTWASIFHIIMAMDSGVSLFSYGLIGISLFISVWLPCCISDIIFPLLLIRDKDIA